MKTKAILCCVAAMSIAIVGCKKDPKPTPEPSAPAELTLTADKTEEYAGGSIIVTSSNAIKSFTAKDNLEIKDYELSVEKTSENTLSVFPGSGSTHVSNGTARIDSRITVTVTDINDQTETIELKGKSWYFDVKVGDPYGTGLAYSDVKVGDKVYVSVTSVDAKNLVPSPVTLSLGAGYKSVDAAADGKNYYIYEIKSASDYEIKAFYKKRVLTIVPQSVH